MSRILIAVTLLLLVFVVAPVTSVRLTGRAMAKLAKLARKGRELDGYIVYKDRPDVPLPTVLPPEREAKKTGIRLIEAVRGVRFRNLFRRLKKAKRIARQSASNRPMESMYP